MIEDTALKIMCDFKKTLPRKKRTNIDQAFRKINSSEPLSKRELEAYTEFQEFVKGAILDDIQ